ITIGSQLVSTISEFVFVGFAGLQQNFHNLFSIAVFLIYNISLYANGIVIAVVTAKRHLHKPMYIIIANLALSDLLLDTMTLPKILAMSWFGDNTIPFHACFFQMFFVHSLGSLDSFIIMLMAFDRYVAICEPLRYFSIISNRLMVGLCGAIWILAAFAGLGITLLGAKLYYCGPKRVKNYFCTVTQVAVLACDDPGPSRRGAFIIGMIVHFIPLSFIIFSYAMIIRTIRSASSSDGWQKAFYTCTTHLFVIGMYFVPRLVVYIYNQVQLMSNADLNVLIICLYTFVPHFLSPIIYCLRTEEIKRTLIRSGKVKPPS
uniref:Olfactory receptor n=1 Tax=Leptobrachium leishanense TaxID=445787 RepID=A0A8C5Q3P1_9ANUR